MTKEEYKVFYNLLSKFDDYEQDCWDKIGFLSEHNFALEKQAMDMKRRAYHDCYRELRQVLTKVEVE